MAVITLTTDFGLADSYVGAMKGLLLSRCPEAQLVDITHEVPPQNIRAGAMRLAAAARYFPPRTVHLAVVDPGVGSDRRAVAVYSCGQTFVGPDNGLLSIAAPPGSPGWQGVELTREDLWLTPVSSTFHGRDVFAPVAAHLASGQPLEVVGRPIDSILILDLPRPQPIDEGLRGTVIDVDRFGNLITNVREEHLTGRRLVEAIVGEIRIEFLTHRYDPQRALVTLFNSDGWLEVAAPGGSAATRLGRGLDTPVLLRLEDGNPG